MQRIWLYIYIRGLQGPGQIRSQVDIRYPSKCQYTHSSPRSPKTAPQFTIKGALSFARLSRRCHRVVTYGKVGWRERS